jgi:hypothetical protein
LSVSWKVRLELGKNIGIKLLETLRTLKELSDEERKGHAEEVEDDKGELKER